VTGGINEYLQSDDNTVCPDGMNRVCDAIVSFDGSPLFCLFILMSDGHLLLYQYRDSFAWPAGMAGLTMFVNRSQIQERPTGIKEGCERREN